MIEREGKSIYSVLCIKEKVETYLVHSLKSLYNVTGGSQLSHPHQETYAFFSPQLLSPSGEARPPPAALRSWEIFPKKRRDEPKRKDPEAGPEAEPVTAKEGEHLEDGC